MQLRDISASTAPTHAADACLMSLQILNRLCQCSRTSALQLCKGCRTFTYSCTNLINVTMGQRIAVRC